MIHAPLSMPARTLLAATLLALLPACTGAEEAQAPSESLAAEPVAASPSVALRIEQAERKLDVGRDAASARAALEQAMADPAATPEQRDQARLSSSRAFEAEGNQEQAIASVEALLASHPDNADWPLERAARARLRELLTGQGESAPRFLRDDEAPSAPFAHALTRYFPKLPNGTTKVKVLALASGTEKNARLGTFQIDRAIREEAHDACSLCEEAKVHMDFSRVRDWTAIATYRQQLGAALAVYYFDLESGRIPPRYDAELPLPAAEIVARLERGEGVLAVRERPGAPPAILIAAPRTAQLPDVEEKLAAMTKLPEGPVTVPVTPKLRPAEIQGVVRHAFKDLRLCYETQLAKTPDAAGKIVLDFSILSDGSVEGQVVNDGASSLHDPELHRCLTAVTGKLSFPAVTGEGKTTVVYPIVFSP